MSNRWFYLAIAALLISAWMLRWDIYAQHKGEGYGLVYLVDRWTGEIWSLGDDERMLVKKAK